MSTDSAAQDFAPLKGNEPATTLAVRYGLDSRTTPRLIGLAMLIAWLPLLLLSLIEGVAFGDKVTITFFSDYAALGRYLLALPIVLSMDFVVAHRMSLAVNNLLVSGVIAAADEERFKRTVAAIGRTWGNKIVLAAFAVLTYVSVMWTVRWGQRLETTNWMADHDQLTLAGGWNFFVSAPLLRWLALRALWKLAVWAWFLVRLSKCDLQLNALHPDGRCGLRFLGDSQLAFVPLVCGLGLQLGCAIALDVRFGTRSLHDFQLVAGALVVISVLIVLGATLVFTRRAWDAREQAEQAFGAWASASAAYMSKLLSSEEKERVPEQLGTSEISSITDASALFDRVLATQPIPFTLRQVSVLAAASTVSILLPLAALLPLSDILQGLAQMMF